jgi:hypothetical protein
MSSATDNREQSRPTDVASGKNVVDYNRHDEGMLNDAPKPHDDDVTTIRSEKSSATAASATQEIPRGDDRIVSVKNRLSTLAAAEPSSTEKSDTETTGPMTTTSLSTTVKSAAYYRWMALFWEQVGVFCCPHFFHSLFQ